MLSARELESLLVKQFDETRSSSLIRELTHLIKVSGIDGFEAAERAERIAGAVKQLLSRRAPTELPFEFGSSDPMRLVGKRRLRSADSEQTRFARWARPLVGAIHDALCDGTDDEFEIACATALWESGASEMIATCSGDDGGIDVYGRLPLRAADTKISQGVLETTLLPQRLLVLGQCKRFHPDARIGRPELQKFLGAVVDCLNQYDGNDRPPSHRVPHDYYRRGEACIKVFLTTAEYTDTSVGEANANDLVLVTGRRLAEFLTARRAGVREDAQTGQPYFERAALDAWLRDAGERHKRRWGP
jgi:hypothetical protein